MGSITPGGAGVFLENAIKSINENKVNLNIVVLALFASDKENEVKEKFLNRYENLKFLFQVKLLSEDLSKKIELMFPDNWYAQNSLKIYESLKILQKNESIDYVEFPDYTGLSFFTLKAKYCSKEFQQMQVIIRLHGSMGRIYANLDRTYPASVSDVQMLEMESTTMNLADLYFTPSASIFEEYKKIYQIKNNNYIVSPPQVIPPFNNIWQDNQENEYVLFYGRYDEIKGTDIFIKAALKFLDKHPESKHKFIIAGGNTFHLSGKNYKTLIEEYIPEKYKDKFELYEFINRDTLNTLIKKSNLAVICSKWESFCISLHEMKASGIPIIASRLNGFTDYFKDGEDLLFFQNKNSSDLCSKIELVLESKELRQRLSSKKYDIERLRSIDSAYETLLSTDCISDKALRGSTICKKLKKEEKSLHEKVNLLNSFTVKLNKTKYKILQPI